MWSLDRTYQESRRKLQKPVKTFGSILKRPEDKFSEVYLPVVFTKSNSKDCEKVYIRQTSCALKIKKIEHNRDVVSGDTNSLLAQHCAKKQSMSMIHRKWNVVRCDREDCFWKCGIRCVTEFRK